MRKILALLTSSLLLAAAATQAQPTTYQFYYGNLHAHTGYSDGNQDSVASGRSTPLLSYQFAAASQHFDFLRISEHNHSQAGMRRVDYALGRPVLALALNQPQPAGPHTLDVPTQGLAAGLYTVRVLAAGAPAYRKLVVGQ